MPKTLLLADDSITIQRVVGITFANEDYEITTVDNGDDAVTKAKELKPDIVLADVIMPKKNGYEVCQAVKQDPELMSTPVLLLAGTFEAFDENRAREVGANGHITKPFESQALIDKVNELVGAAPSPAMPSPLQPVASTTPTPTARPAAPPAAAAMPPPTIPTVQPTQPAAAPQPPVAPSREPLTPTPVTPPFSPPPSAATQMPKPMTPPAAAPRPITPRPLKPTPLEPRPLEPRPLEPRPLERRPLEPKPLEPRPLEPRPLEPTPLEPSFAEPTPFETPTTEPGFPKEPMPTIPEEAEPIGGGLSPAPEETTPTFAPDLEQASWGKADNQAAQPFTTPSFTPPARAPLPTESSPIEEKDFFRPREETLAELAQQTPLAEPPPQEELPSVDIDDEGLVDEGIADQKVELAPMHEFIPKAEPEERTAETEAIAASIPRKKLEAIARETIEKIAWEVVPQLAETILREEIDKLVKDKLSD